MRIFVYGTNEPAVLSSVDTLTRLGVTVTNDLPASDIAIAPLLTKKLSAEQIHTPRLGTLIFHPSLLPRHRGRDAIKWAFRLGENYTGVTWFWAAEGYDAGDICEQSVLEILNGESPRDFYNRAVIPEMQTLLSYIVADLRNGVVRRRPQRESAATFEPPVKKEIFLQIA